MSDKRKTDATARSQFRTDRMFEDSGKWYFNTREGTIEGPFSDRLEAVTRLEAYVRLIESGLAPREGKYSLSDLEIV